MSGSLNPCYESVLVQSMCRDIAAEMDNCVLEDLRNYVVPSFWADFPIPLPAKGKRKVKPVYRSLDDDWDS